jgi:hypothetical protein
MGNRFNFKSNRPVIESVEPPAPSKAEAFGIKPPPLSAEQQAGARVENLLAGDALNAKITRYETFKAERLAAERARDDAIWAKVLARQRAAI